MKHIKRTVIDENGVMTQSEYTRYSNREKIDYHKQQAKQGAVHQDGTPVSDFERGRHSAMVAVIGNRMGRNKMRLAQQSGDPRQVAQVRSERQTYRERRRAEKEAYKAQKAADKVAKRGKK